MIDNAKKPWIDISVPLKDAMVHWPSDPPVSIKRVKDKGTVPAQVLDKATKEEPGTALIIS